MTDLIERLRATVEHGALSIRVARNALNEAADALEAQSARIEELEQSRDGWKDRYCRADATLAEALDRAREAEAEAAKLRAERDALRQHGLEALRLAHELEKQAVARLRRLVRDAYHEGKFAGGKTWEESKACRALGADHTWERKGH